MGTFPIPANGDYVFEAWGDGEEGVFGGNDAWAGPGGGGGEYARRTLTLTAGETVTVGHAPAACSVGWEASLPGPGIVIRAKNGCGSVGGTGGVGDLKRNGGDGGAKGGFYNAVGGGGGTGARRATAGVNGSGQTGASDGLGGLGGTGGAAGVGSTGHGGDGGDASGFPGNGGGGRGGSGTADPSPLPPTQGQPTRGGLAIWAAEDWDAGAGAPVPGAEPIYSEGNFEAAPTGAKARKSAFIM